MTKKPDKAKFLEDFNNAVDHFVDHSYPKIIAISHNDADGISSLHIIQNLLYQLKIDYDYFIYNRSVSWENYLNGIFSKRQSEKTAFIFTDLGSNLAELIPIIRNRKEHFYILDHHEVEDDIRISDIPENLFFVNPTIHGYDGLEHISGATLTYMFVKQIKPSIIKQGWLTIIGIAGDSLKSMDKLQSFNREVYEELISEELVEDKEGLTLFGSMHDSIKNSLKYSILPYINGIGGESDNKIISFLNSIQINPTTKVVDLNKDEIYAIQQKVNVDCYGHYALLPHKAGLLKFAFEHALLLNILCFKNISAAISITQLKTITRYAKNLYMDYINNLVNNLKTVSNELPTSETEKAIFIEVKGKIPPSNWSDTASFSAVNELVNPYKILFLGGLEMKSGTIKLSIRCSRKYLVNNEDNGVNSIIYRIKKELGGVGGGHKLAGGIRLSLPSYNRLKKNAEDFI
ncbi:MAG: DHH family phosphoesterase [Candidatus Lokiarchaeota archaeon]|nr:DHH family phosphoesterase [Candidatus Lokiarchaeota archaeon]